MYATAARFNFENPSLPFTTGKFSEIPTPRVARVKASPSGLCEKTQSAYRTSNDTQEAPRLVRSVVDEAGLGKFVYLQGRSGRRYVFSSIRREQVALYDHALFACSDPSKGDVQVSQHINDCEVQNGTLYVHLLDDEICNAASALTDLGA